jgi:hypothetical protein
MCVQVMLPPSRSDTPRKSNRNFAAIRKAFMLNQQTGQTGSSWVQTVSPSWMSSFNFDPSLVRDRMLGPKQVMKFVSLVESVSLPPPS